MSELRVGADGCTTAKIRCPQCGGWDCRVRDSRGTNNAVRRRRKCAGCGCRFTTYEVVEGQVPTDLADRLRVLRHQLEVGIARIDRFLTLETDGDGR